MGCSGSSDLDAMCATSDARCAVAMDVMIDELPAREQWAVYNKWIAAVSHIRGNEDELYASAKERLGRGLRAKGIW